MRCMPQRVVVEVEDGTMVDERAHPRDAFAGHARSTPWDLLHQAYCNGYARWTSLTTPCLMAMPGVEVADREPWHEGKAHVVCPYSHATRGNIAVRLVLVASQA